MFGCLLHWLLLWAILNMGARLITQGWVHFTEVDCLANGNMRLSIFITLLLPERCNCIAPFYRWENGGAESRSHLADFLKQELWEVGLQPSVGDSSQMHILPLELPKGSNLRCEWRSSQDVCMGLWRRAGCVHMDWGACGTGKHGEPKTKESCFISHIFRDRQGFDSSHRGVAFNEDDLALSHLMVEASRTLVALESTSSGQTSGSWRCKCERDFLNYFIFSDKNALCRIKITVCIPYASCSSVNGP